MPPGKLPQKCHVLQLDAYEDDGPVSGIGRSMLSVFEGGSQKTAGAFVVSLRPKVLHVESLPQHDAYVWSSLTLRCNWIAVDHAHSKAALHVWPS